MQDRGPPPLHPSLEIQLRQDCGNRRGREGARDLASRCWGGRPRASRPSVPDWGGTVAVPGHGRCCRAPAAPLMAGSVHRAFDGMVTSMMIQVC